MRKRKRLGLAMAAIAVTAAFGTFTAEAAEAGPAAVMQELSESAGSQETAQGQAVETTAEVPGAGEPGASMACPGILAVPEGPGVPETQTAGEEAPAVPEVPTMEAESKGSVEMIGPEYGPGGGAQADMEFQTDGTVADELPFTAGFITADYQGRGGGCFYRGVSFSLTDEELRWITACCIMENGSDPNAIRYEASLLANLTDRMRSDSPYDVMRSGWFADTSKARAEKTALSVTEEQIAIVRNVLCDGMRATRANEHDCFSDITKIVTLGIVYTSPSEIRNRGNYLPGNTVIYNRMGSVYLFETFPSSCSDPFGVILSGV